MNQLSSAEYRARAREGLKNQWGKLAGITFVAVVLEALIGGLFNSIFNLFGGNPQNENYFSSNFLDIVLLFAFSYGLYYIALYAARQGRINLEMLFSIFNKDYYLPMLILNLCEKIVGALVGIIIFAPVLSVVGVGFLLQYAFGNPFNNLSHMVTSGALTGTFAFLFLLLMLLMFIVGFIVDGFFKMAAWTRLDFPQLSIGQTFSYAWFLLKDRIPGYIKLQLSFIGWGILSTFTLFIGLFWLLPYNNVATATFYDVARAEKGDPVLNV